MLRQYEIPQCPICFDELTVNLSATKCGHVFHRQCIEKALSRNPCCPLDRVVNSLDGLRGLAYSVSFKENADIDNFFKDIPDDQKRSIEKLSLKLQSMLQEKQRLSIKCTGLHQQNSDFQDQLQRLENKIDDDQKLINSQKNQISTFKSQVEYKQVQLEDIERDKQKMNKEMESLQRKVQELKNLNEVVQMMDKFENELEQRNNQSSNQILSNDSSFNYGVVSTTARAIDWAKRLQETNSVQQQADLFYEAYRVILVKEDSYKSRIERYRQENDSLQDYKREAGSDLASLNRKCQNFIDKNKNLKKMLDNAISAKSDGSVGAKSPKENFSQKAEMDNMPTKKRKIDELNNIVKFRDPKLENDTQKEFSNIDKSTKSQDPKQPQRPEAAPTMKPNPFSKSKEEMKKTPIQFTKSQNLLSAKSAALPQRQSFAMAGSFLNTTSMLNNKTFYKDQLKQNKIYQQKQAVREQQNAKQPGINNFLKK